MPTARSTRRISFKNPVRRRLALPLPVEGTWKVLRSPGHARFAFDLVAVDDAHHALAVSRVRHLFGRARAEDAHSWGRPVYSPADGVVVRSSDVRPDRERLSLPRDLRSMVFSRPAPDDLGAFAGNHLIIESESVYVFMAHLQHGSLQVVEGDVVRAGQEIGRVGNSGFTLEPHLHFQLFDDISTLPEASAPPFVVTEFERWTGSEWRREVASALTKGDVIRSIPG